MLSSLLMGTRLTSAYAAMVMFALSMSLYAVLAPAWSGVSGRGSRRRPSRDLMTSQTREDGVDGLRVERKSVQDFSFSSWKVASEAILVAVLISMAAGSPGWSRRCRAAAFMLDQAALHLLDHQPLGRGREPRGMTLAASVRRQQKSLAALSRLG